MKTLGLLGGMSWESTSIHALVAADWSIGK